MIITHQTSEKEFKSKNAQCARNFSILHHFFQLFKIKKIATIVSAKVTTIKSNVVDSMLF